MSAGPALDLAAVLAGAVHDAKNSLGVMLGSVERLGAGCASAECDMAAALEDVRHEGRRVNAALMRLLVLYRMQQGDYRPTPSPHEVDECIESCGLEHARAFVAKGIDLEVDTGEPQEWLLDRELVDSVLQGALHNALKFARGRARLGARLEGGWLVLQVEDDGPGFPSALLDGAAAGIDRARGGTGLGLTLAARAAAAHTAGERVGRIEIDNAGALGGARFSLYLP